MSQSAAYLLDWTTGQWTQVSDMQRQHNQHVCQPVGHEGKILVTGYGETYEEHFTEIYDPRTDTWVDGSPIPMTGDLRAARSVKYWENVLVIGGVHEENPSRYIWEYVVKSDSWRLRDERLEEPRSHFVAIFVPDDVKLCRDGE